MEKFYLGLDIGTDSVGIAATDENYRLLRAKGKDLWAVRLFDEAKTAVDRRTKRAMRRRMARRRRRIEWLQALFAPMMTDETFFLRLNNSAYLMEDKDSAIKNQYVLFADDNFTDKQFYEDFPTIFHLRKALIDHTAPKDIRLYYIALHHIIKYRGHFLFDGQEISEIRDLKKLIDDLNEYLVSIAEDDDPISFVTDRLDDFKKNAMGKGGDRKNVCYDLLGINGKDKDKAKYMKDMVNAMLGYSFSTKTLFGEEEGKTYSFAKLKDDECDSLIAQYELLGYLKAIYNYILFENVFSGCNYISEAMIKVYEKHKEDLNVLKGLFRCDKTLFDEMFRQSDAKLKNYSAYIGGRSHYNGKGHKGKHCTRDEFYKFLSDKLKANESKFTDIGALEYVRNKLNDGTLLPLILHADNGLFPYQVNEAELKKILENAEKDFPEFAKKTDGLTVSDRIRSIMRFRIPYYVGPLNDYHKDKGGNSWIVKKKEGKILPWNFDEMVDKAASNEAFMRRMTSKCSYIHGADVLPKCSVIYQKFNTLNQLNKLKINGEAISVELKQRLYNDLFLIYPKVSSNKIKKYLTDNGLWKKSEAGDLKISCEDNELTASMSTYITLRQEKYLGNLADTNEELCEDIVLWHTLNTDKRVVEKLIRKKYSDILDENRIRMLKGLNFKDFGRLSKEFLCNTYGKEDEDTGEVSCTILGELYNTNMNIMELINSPHYDFQRAIDRANGKDSEEVTYKTLEDMYVSPATRRGIWQALKMCDEYVGALGKTPDKIFLEVTRTNKSKDKGKKTKSRKEILQELYKDCENIDELLGELNGKSDMDLRSERLYLYFRQLGRCAYTGEKIDLEYLPTDTYDVDHIVPRSVVKDDSLENKVLCKRTKNAAKTDVYPLPAGFTNQQPLWKILHEKGLMGDKKYNALMRVNPLTESEKEGFVQRQLVITSQSVKAVAELLQKKYPETKVVYSKAENVGDFRNKFDFYKCRETNDLHHARDAYLNIVAGNVYDTHYTKLYNMYKNGAAPSLSGEYKLFERDIVNAWNMNESIATVRKVMSRFTMSVTRFSYCDHGAFYNETVYAAGNGNIDAPMKMSTPLRDTDKYGGYKSLSTAYFAVVMSLDKNNQPIKTIERVPVLIDYKLKNNPNALIEYFGTYLKNPEIYVPKIGIKSLIEYNGMPVRLAGVTGNQVLLHNAVQWFTDNETDRYVKAISKLLDLDAKNQLNKDNEFYDVHKNRKEEVILRVDKTANIALYDKIIEQLSRSVYNCISGAKYFKDNIISHRNEFEKLTVYGQINTLYEIIKFLECKGLTANLEAIGLVKNAGKILINKDITNANVVLINSSPCGLHVTKRKL